MSQNVRRQLQEYSTTEIVTWYSWNTHASPTEALACATALGSNHVTLQHVQSCFREASRVLHDDDAPAPAQVSLDASIVLHSALMIHRHGQALLGLKKVKVLTT